MRLLVILTAVSAVIAVPLPARSKKRSQGESGALYPRGAFPDNIQSPENASPATLVADSNTGPADNQHQVDSNAISIQKSNDEPDLAKSFFDDLSLALDVHAATVKTIFKNAPEFSVPLGVTALSSYAI